MNPASASDWKHFLGDGVAAPCAVLLLIAVIVLWRSREMARAAWDAERTALQAAHLETAKSIAAASKDLAQGVMALQALSMRHVRREQQKSLEVAK